MSNSPTATVAEAVATDALLQPRRELHNYSDHANEADTGILEDSDGKPTHASDRNFPVKLHYMLSELEDDEQDHIVGWAPHGRCFVVHDQEEFVRSILPMWFRQSKFASFQRQLNLYGFKRITTGRDKKGYYHELFLRSRRFLSHRIPRIKLKGTGSRKPTSPDTEPNFYLLPYLPSEKKVTDKQEVVTVPPTHSNSVTFGGMPGPNRVEKSSSLDQLVQSSNLPGLSFNGAFGAGGMGQLSALTNFAADNPFLCSYALGLPMSGLTTTGIGGNDSARTTTATPNQMLAYHDLLAMRLALWNRTNTGGGNNNNNNNMMMMMNNAVATTAGVTARSSSNHPHSDGSGPDRGDPSTRPSSATA